MDSLCFRPLSGSYISQSNPGGGKSGGEPEFPSPIGELHFSILIDGKDENGNDKVSVPYRGATFLNCNPVLSSNAIARFRPLSGSYISQSSQILHTLIHHRFRPLSGSYISQYHPRNPMFCLGQIGGLRGKSNFIEMQPFWKVKNSHKSSI